MKFDIKNINRFLLFKLPTAYFTGIRIIYIDENKSVFSVKHRWINQNPFQSMYFAVQAMAAEISTGVLVMQKIKQSGKNVSMLVTTQDGKFTKKATGVIKFMCKDGNLIDEKLNLALKTGEGQTFNLYSEGKNDKEEIVSQFNFQWSIKVK